MASVCSIIANFVIAFQFFTQYISACSETLHSAPNECAADYIRLINPHYRKLSEETQQYVTDFHDYLKELPGDDYVWYEFFQTKKGDFNINYCTAVLPIYNELSSECLCQLPVICDDRCDKDIGRKFTDTAEIIMPEDPYKIPYEYGVTHTDCQNVMKDITEYEPLCGDTDIYKVIQECANGTPSPADTPTKKPSVAPSKSTTLTPTLITTALPTISPIKITPNPTKSETTSSTAKPTTTTSTSQPTLAIVETTKSVETGNKESSTSTSTTSTPTEAKQINTNAPSKSPTAKITDSSDYEYNYYGLDPDIKTTEVKKDDAVILDSKDSSPSTTQDIYAMEEASHPFANLLLVSLIILGFCTFVAWYAKKNQISENGMNGNDDDDNGYLWGLNKASSSESMHNKSEGNSRHKKLMFDDHHHNVEMTMNDNNDLLAITPDHIGRLQTHRQQNKHKRTKTKRRGKGGKFEQLKDYDDPTGNGDESMSDSGSSGSDGVDMMKMRDQYYASQTFSKRLTDTLGDIHDTVTQTVDVVKTKLSKKEQTVVVPMNMQIKENKQLQQKKGKKKRPFVVVEDNETTDAFDLSESVSSNSTQENEYREDSETETRVNLHGRRIKQPMALPTFEEDEEDDDEDEDMATLVQSHSESQSKAKKKKKRKKKKRNKKKKEKKEEKVVSAVVSAKKNENKMEVETEVHEVNVNINQSLNMGFDDDELNEEHIKSSKQIEMTKDEVTMTMNDLQMELMKHKQEEEEQNDGTTNMNVDMDMDIVQNIEENEQSIQPQPQQEEVSNNVDLSFMNDVMSGNGNNEKNEDVSNEITVGNGNAPLPEIVEN